MKKYRQNNQRYQDTFEQQDDYYKPERVGNFWNNNYIEYKSCGYRNKYFPANTSTLITG